MLERLWGSSKKLELKPTNALGLNTDALKGYLDRRVLKKLDEKAKKQVITHYCRSALEIGKCQIGFRLLEKIEKASEANKARYEELLEDLYLAYKINEFLEKPYDYSQTSDHIKSVFTDRAGLTSILELTKDLDFWDFAKMEVERLYDLFKNMFYQSVILSKEIRLPLELPEYMKTGSINPFCYSEFHPIIKELYDQCQKKIAELAEKEKALSLGPR